MMDYFQHEKKNDFSTEIVVVPKQKATTGLIFLLKAIRPKDQNLTFAEMVKDKIDSGGLDFDVLRKKVKYSRRSSRRTSLLQPQKRRQR